jgi:hypothetical protein
MNQVPAQNDLVVLAADQTAEMAMRGILSRPEALEIRPVSAEFIVHPEHDPGCIRTPHQFLRSYVRSHAHAIVVLDREGCGREATRPELEQDIEGLLERNGWSSRSAVIVLDPELEIWVWSDSPEVDAQLGWTGRQPDLRTWLRQKGFLSPDAAKPSRPKEAMQAALYEVRLPWSSSIHGQLAGRVSFRRCADPGFEKLKRTLQQWFPKAESFPA